jgi:AcrR family transcriptional regulator
MPRSTWDNLDERRRERVLHAAMAEFGRRGYSGGSLNVISREAGVAKGSLFQYFEDKFDFFAHVAEQTSLTVYAAMTPYLDGPAPGETFLNYFARLIDTWMQYMADHPLERGVTAATNLELDPEIRRVIREPVHRLYTQALRPLINGAIEDGEISAEADIEALLALLILLLPHLALAPFEPGLDAALPLYRTSRQERVERASRLVATVFAASLVST